MNPLLTLLLYSLKRVRNLILAMGAMLAIFQVIMILVAGSLLESHAFDKLNTLIPPFMRELMGPSFIGMMSYGGIVCVGYFHIAVIGALSALAISQATTMTSEIETGFMDLILSRPLARHWVITRSVLLVAACIAALLAIMMAGTWMGLSLFGPARSMWPSRRLILLLAANLGLLMLCWSGVAMAIGSAARRRGVAGAVAGLLVFGTFLLDYVARAWRPAGKIAWISPFRYYSPLDLVMGKALPLSHVWILAGIAFAGFAAAYFAFFRRDISH